MQKHETCWRNLTHPTSGFNPTSRAERECRNPRDGGWGRLASLLFFQGRNFRSQFSLVRRPRGWGDLPPSKPSMLACEWIHPSLCQKGNGGLWRRRSGPGRWCSTAARRTPRADLPWERCWFSLLRTRAWPCGKSAHPPSQRPPQPLDRWLGADEP